MARTLASGSPARSGKPRSSRRREIPHSLGQAPVEHVHHPFDGNFEDQLRPSVEELGAVDVRQMANGIHPIGSCADGCLISNIADDELDPVDNCGRAGDWRRASCRRGTELRHPRPTRARTRALPRKPVPPVTSILLPWKSIMRAMTRPWPCERSPRRTFRIYFAARSSGSAVRRRDCPRGSNFRANRPST